MTDLRTAAQQALEALEWHYRQGHSNTIGGFRLKIDEKALRELRAALAQQAEPLNLSDRAVQRRLATQWGYVPAAQAEPVEPVAWVASKDGRTIQDNDFTHDVVLRVVGDFENDEQRIRYAQRIVDKLNAAQPQRTMVPLTEEEIDALPWNGSPQQFARAVELAHGIKEN